MPQILNLDNGSEFTDRAIIGLLRHHVIMISVDGRGHLRYNLNVEPFSNSITYEEVYLHPC